MWIRKGILTGVGLAMLYLIVSLSGNIWGMWRSGERLAEAESQAKVLAREHYQLEELKKQVESGEYKEKEIREKLHLTKPGETVVMLPEGTKELEEQKGGKAEEQERKMANWEKWRERFVPGAGVGPATSAL